MPLFRKSNGKSTLFRSINADLRLAASQGDVPETLELLKKGAKFIPNKEGRTALHLAVSNAHTNVVQTLIEHGCDLNHKDKLGYTALHRACFEGSEDIVRILLDANAKVDEQDFVQENTALHEAAWRGHSGCVELLLKAKANVYVRNKIGATALHLACQNGYNLSCRLLLQHGCKPNVKDKYDDTPLHTACRYLHLGVARILLSENNINTNEQNKNGDTPLHLSCNLGQKKLSKMLLEHEARSDLKNKQGETPLDIAVRKQQSELVQILKQSSMKNGKHQKAVEKKTKSKIRERLKLTQDPESSWQLLFQDWMPPYQLESPNGPCTALKPCPNTVYPVDSQLCYPHVQPVSSGDMNNGIGHKGPVTCYCVPLLRRLAQHNNEAHRELLEEIDACQTNLNGEICDLRQVTERKLTDINRKVKTGLEREGITCTQRIIKFLDQGQIGKGDLSTRNNYLHSTRSTAKLIRSKSESELETDVERERTTAAQIDSDSMSNASGDAYFDRYLIQHATLNRKPKHNNNNNCNNNNSKNNNAPYPFRCAAMGAQFRTQRNFDETVRQFNKIDMENLNDSSCTTPTTASSSGNNRGTGTTSGGEPSARISLYSCQSNQSSSQQSTTNGGKIVFQPPSVDSGYGTKVENSPIHLTFPAFLLSPTACASSPEHESPSSTTAKHHSAFFVQKQQQNEVENSSPFNRKFRVDNLPMTPTSPSSAFRPVIPSSRYKCSLTINEKVAEVETQTDSATTSDSHEYTELECILRSTAAMNHQHKYVAERIKDNLRSIKPPPILPIPPPPRKPLPPLPTASGKSAKRRLPTAGCLSTNV